MLHAGHDCHGSEVGRGDARAAETIQGHAARFDVIASRQGRHATQVAALLNYLCTGSPDHVIHVSRVKAVSLLQRFQDRGTQMARVQMSQGAFTLFADTTRGAAGVNDQGCSHVRYLASHKKTGQPTLIWRWNRLTPIGVLGWKKTIVGKLLLYLHDEG